MQRLKQGRHSLARAHHHCSSLPPGTFTDFEGDAVVAAVLAHLPCIDAECPCKTNADARARFEDWSERLTLMVHARTCSVNCGNDECVATKALLDHVPCDGSDNRPCAENQRLLDHWKFCADREECQICEKACVVATKHCLGMLFHARTCNDSRCQVNGCRVAKNMLACMKTRCTGKRTCRSRSCGRAHRALEHWRSCATVDCTICMVATEYDGVIKNQFDLQQWTLAREPLSDKTGAEKTMLLASYLALTDMWHLAYADRTFLNTLYAASGIYPLGPPTAFTQQPYMNLDSHAIYSIPESHVMTVGDAVRVSWKRWVYGGKVTSTGPGRAVVVTVPYAEITIPSDKVKAIKHLDATTAVGTPVLVQLDAKTDGKTECIISERRANGDVCVMVPGDGSTTITCPAAVRDTVQLADKVGQLSRSARANAIAHLIFVPSFHLHGLRLKEREPLKPHAFPARMEGSETCDECGKPTFAFWECSETTCTLCTPPDVNPIKYRPYRACNGCVHANVATAGVQLQQFDNADGTQTAVDIGDPALQHMASVLAQSVTSLESHSKSATNTAALLMIGAHNNRLKSVNFSGCSRITGAVLRRLASKSQNLPREPDAQDNAAGGPPHPNNFPVLTDVNFSSCNITNEDVEYFVAAVVDTMTRVDVSNCLQLSDVAVVAVAACHNLLYVDFSGCTNITDAGVCNMLDRCPTLQRCNFRGCSNLTMVSVAKTMECSNLIVDFAECANVEETSRSAINSNALSAAA